MNRYFLHYAIANLDVNEKSSIWKLYDNDSGNSALSYDNGFQMYEDIIDENFIEKLSALFTNLKQIVDKVVKDQTGNGIQSINDKIRSYLPAWFSSFDFIPQYKKDKGKYEVSKDSFGNKLYKVTTLNQSPRVVFFGICRYLEECKSFDEGQFKRWMRVVCNLTENNTVDTIDAMRSRIKLINELSCHCTDIYGFLSDETSEIKSDAAKDQLSEEIEKARQILTGNYNGNIPELKGKTWEDVIIEAENYAFFNGAVRFLFRNEKGEWDWKDFDTKWKNAQGDFDKDGVVKNNSSILLRFFISKFDEKNVSENKNWSLFWEMVYDNSANSWKDLLTKEKWKRPIHEVLISNDIKINPGYQSTFKTSEWKNIQEELVKTNLLECIGKNCSLCYRYDNYLLTLPGRCLDKNKYIIGNHRNKILVKLYDGDTGTRSKQTGKVYSDQKIDGCDFFWGLDVYFQYKKGSKVYDFVWYRDDFVYPLVKGDFIEKIKLSGKELDENNFLRKLDGCIKEY